MTERQPTLADAAAAFEAFGKQLQDAFAEMTFDFTARNALSACLRGEPHDQAHTRLSRLTTDQLQRVDRAARQLLTITNGLLEDREADQVAADIDAAQAAEASNG